ncbi:MAG: hypothetical protein HY904_05620 [Deltaproteobacteria bacterium]|nr:hypothetical protein [Deltaproteobacteria bacterium]
MGEIGQTACAGDADFYTFTVDAPGPGTQVRVQYNPVGEIATEVTERGQAVVLGTGVNAGGYSTVTFDSTAGRTYVLQASYAGTGAGTDTEIQFARGFCLGDELESNDSEATASAYADLQAISRNVEICEADADYFRFAAVRSGMVTVTLLQGGTQFGTLLASAFTAGSEATPLATTGALEVDAARATVTFPAAAGTQYFVKVSNPSGLGRTAYQLALTGDPLTPAPPANDDCSGAIALVANASQAGTLAGAGRTVGLQGLSCTGWPTEGNDVFYTLTIPAGHVATVDLTTADATADLALYLIDGCATACCWAGADVGFYGDPEALVYQNITGAEQALWLGVDTYFPDTQAAFGLTVRVQPDCGRPLSSAVGQPLDACVSNNNCSCGLDCAFGICMKPCMSPGSTDGCDAGDTCVEYAPAEYYCAPVGGLDESCFLSAQCTAGLRCDVTSEATLADGGTTPGTAHCHQPCNITADCTGTQECLPSDVGSLEVQQDDAGYVACSLDGGGPCHPGYECQTLRFADGSLADLCSKYYTACGTAVPPTPYLDYPDGGSPAWGATSLCNLGEAVDTALGPFAGSLFCDTYQQLPSPPEVWCIPAGLFGFANTPDTLGLCWAFCATHANYRNGVLTEAFNADCPSGYHCTLEGPYAEPVRGITGADVPCTGDETDPVCLAIDAICINYAGGRKCGYPYGTCQLDGTGRP